MSILGFSGLQEQVLIWGMAGVLFWALARLPDRESLEFLILDALVLVSSLVCAICIPFVFLANVMPHAVAHPTLQTTLILFLGAVSLVLMGDSYTKMRRFFRD